MSITGFIENQLSAALAPAHLEVINESYLHNVPPNSETHFKLVVVSTAFAGQRRLARHQRIYGLLGAVLKNPVHALALHTYTPEEWAATAAVPPSPECLGGVKQKTD